MIRLSDIFDLTLLSDAIANKHVRRTEHPDGRLAILNYTETCQFDRAWTPVTLSCRGLIYDMETEEVIARPFGKFFNHDEPSAARIIGPVQVTDKLDGSLGILYVGSRGVPAIATRGSFTSEQALHATALYRIEYQHLWTPRPELTYLFEIIYPANRIVVDYGSMDELLLIGAVDTRTGRSLPLNVAASGWPGQVVEEYDYASVAKAVAAEPRPNAEGLVIHCLTTDGRVKLKQEDYKRLHKLLTMCSTRDLWRGVALADLGRRGYDAKRAAKAVGCSPAEAQAGMDAGDQWIEPLLERVPDEFYEWVQQTVYDLKLTFEDQLTRWQIRFESLHLHELETRKEQAYAIIDGAPAAVSVMFSMLDGKDVAGDAWRAVRPEYSRPFAISEDVA